MVDDKRYKYSYGGHVILRKYRGNKTVYQYLAQMIQGNISPQEINVLIRSLNQRHKDLVYNHADYEQIQIVKSIIGGLKAYRVLQTEKQKRIKYKTKLAEFERTEKILQGQLEGDGLQEFIAEDELVEDFSDDLNKEDESVVSEEEFFKKEKKKIIRRKGFKYD